MRRVRRKRVNIFKIILIVFVALIAVNYTANYIVSRINYDKNLTVEETFDYDEYEFREDGFIESIEDIQDFSFSLNYGIDYSPVLAIYNALIYLRNEELYEPQGDILISDIIKFLDTRGQLALGYMGLNPITVNSYFKKLGLNSEIIFHNETAKQKAIESTVGVFFHPNYENIDYKAFYPLSSNEIKFFSPNQSYLFSNYWNRASVGFIALISINVEQPEEQTQE